MVMDIKDMTDEQIAERLMDEPVAAIELDGGNGIVIGVPGEVWADEYITLWVHERDCGVVLPEDPDNDIAERWTDRLQVEIPLDRLPEFRAALDKAEQIVRTRKQE